MLIACIGGKFQMTIEIDVLILNLKNRHEQNEKSLENCKT